MLDKALNRVASIIEQSGRRKKVEISGKRRFYPDHNTGLLVPIDCTPQDAETYHGYKFEVVKHDLHLAFAPSWRGFPFLRITDPKDGGIWALWFMGFGDVSARNPLIPKVVDKGDGFVQWQLDDSSSLKLEIMGHLIRKLLILEKRPNWNKLKFRIARGNATLIDGMALGQQQRRLFAFRKSDIWKKNPLFWFSEPNAWDSKSGEGALPNTIKPKYTLTPLTAGVWEMTIEMDSDWLDSVKYPVYIDPTIVLQPDATEGLDARMIAPAANNNYGSEIYLSTYYSGSNKQNSVVQFDLSLIPAGSTINSAELYLTNYGYGYETYPHRVRAANTTVEWDEMQVTWNDRLTGVAWTNPGGDYGTTYADEGGDTYGDTSLETASLVQLWVDGALSNYGYHLRDDENGHSGGLYYSSDYSTASLRPKLTIDYTEGGGGLPAKLGALAGMRILQPIATGILKI